MIGFQHFKEDEVPYETLQKFGLTREMINDLPQSVMFKLLSGQKTPVLPVTTDNIDGDKVTTMARISLKRMIDGTVDAFIAPIWEDADLHEYPEEIMKSLKEGNVTITSIKDLGECYLQYDEMIKRVWAVPTEIIQHNISLLEGEINTNENKELLKGHVITISDNDEECSIGIDLYEETGIRITRGNKQAWKEDKENEQQLPKYNFGLFGCWMADEDNNLTYVAEDDYDEKMLSEWKRSQSHNAAKAQMQQVKM